MLLSIICSAFYFPHSLKQQGQGNLEKVQTKIHLFIAQTINISIFHRIKS